MICLCFCARLAPQGGSKQQQDVLSEDEEALVCSDKHCPRLLQVIRAHGCQAGDARSQQPLLRGAARREGFQRHR